MSDTKEQAKDHRDLMEAFFSDDPQFKFQGLVAHGCYGSACRVQYNNPKRQDIKDFLIKMAFDIEGARDAMIREREYLQRLRGNRHIVQLINIPENPLEDPENTENPDPSSDDLVIHPDDWIILEWIGCGTLSQFITAARSNGIPRLPNRLLWRFFLCLIRACIAMAWPDNREVMKKDAPAASQLLHNDLHLKNILLGEPPMDGEHGITPILKLIDFGLAGEWSASDSSTGMQLNIFDIGMVMEALISVNRTRLYIQPNEKEAIPVKMGGKVIKTNAKRIIPCPRGVDINLVQLVCACMASDHKNRPTLRSLLTTCLTAVNARNAAYYNHDFIERDSYISDLWIRLTTTPAA